MYDAFSLKHCLHVWSPYFLIKPCLLPHIRLCWWVWAWVSWPYAVSHTYQLLDPGPYFLGWLYHTLLCPITGYSHTKKAATSLKNTLNKNVREKEDDTGMRTKNGRVVLTDFSDYIFNTQQKRLSVPKHITQIECIFTSSLPFALLSRY